MRKYSHALRSWAAVAVVVLASAGLASADGPAVDVQVLDPTPGQTVLDFTFGPYQMQAAEIGGEKFAQIALPGEGLMLEAGAPELPLVARSVIVPDNAKLAVNVLDADYDEFALNIAPSKGNLLRTVDPATVPFEFGEVYDQNAFYPGTLATVAEPYILRDHRGVAVTVYPFQYNPATGILRVYRSIAVEVVDVGAGEVNVLQRTRQPRALSRAFHQIYSHQFLNYGALGRYTPLDEDGDMLIIAHDAWIPNVQPLATHKNGNGINTTVVGVSTIGNNSTSIKNYIQNLYNSSDLAFVLLVGDAAQVATPYSSGGASDPSYAKLAGGDNYPDIMVGRFSAETAAQVDTQVQRTITYETTPATTQAWFKRGVGIASSQGSGIGDEGQADWEHMDEIRQWLFGHGYTVVDQIYDTNGGSASQVTTAVNNGRGVINYCGHGSTTSWGTTGFSNSNVNSLVNNDMLPFIISVACVNGNFDGSTCFGEAWLRATNGGVPTGAIAAYMSSINQSWAPPMEGQDEFNLLLTADAYWSYGALCFAGSCSMMDAYGSGGVEMYDTWHIFGDPSVRVYGQAGPPHGMRVSPSSAFTSEGQVGGPFTPDSMDYVVENMNASGSIQYEVTCTQPWLTITNGMGTLPAGQTATVHVALNSQANWLGNGAHTDVLAFVNLTDHDGDTDRDVTLTVGVPTMQYQWTMDTDPGWTTEGQWAWGQPTGSGGSYGGPDPTSGYTGPNVYGYNLNGDYANNLPERHLTSGAIDCSNLTDVSLKFQRWLGVETATYDHAYVRVSNDGVTWTTLWENSSTVSDSSWQFQEFDMSAVADNEPTVYLRWTMGTTDWGWAYCGWNIDDVEVWGLAPSDPQFAPGDLNCDGALNAADIDPFVLALTDPAGYAAAYPNCNAGLADMNGDGSVNAADIDPFVGAIVP